MFFNIFAGLFVVISLAFLYSAVRLLMRRGWVLAWLKGMLGLTFIAASVLLGLVALDLIGYRQLQQEKPVGTIDFTRSGPQMFEANLLLAGDTEERTFVLKGDQWQLDVRLIRWKGFFSNLGAKPGYRLDRLSGRYYSLEDERSAERTVYALEDKQMGPDVWAWLRDNSEFMPWVDAVYGSATFVPMADGALYEITLTNSGLAARPLNSVAQSALKQWR